MNMLHRLVTAEPLLALFVTIALGYLVGKIRIGSFVLGGIAGTLLIGVIIGQLGACPNSGCSILSESDSTLGYEQVFSPLEYRSDAASAAECAGLRAERPCLAVYR